MRTARVAARPSWLAAAALVLALLAAAPGARAEGFAIGAKIGTPGLGPEATLGLSPTWNLRGGFFLLDFADTLEEDGIEYKGEIGLSNAGLMLDWHPLRGNLRLSAGMMWSGNGFDGGAAGLLEVGSRTYDASLDLDVDWDGLAPYLGVGWGNAVRDSRRWSLSFDVGLVFIGEPKVRLAGMVDNPLLQPLFQQDLLREQQELQEELNDYTLFPVVALGVAYRF